MSTAEPPPEETAPVEPIQALQNMVTAVKAALADLPAGQQRQPAGEKLQAAVEQAEAALAASGPPPEPMVA